MRAYQSRRIHRAIFIAILISLLLHIIFFISFLESNKKNRAQDDTDFSLLQKQKDEHAWAARKARASQFGAPVVFQSPTHDEPAREEETKEEHRDQSESIKQNNTAIQEEIQKTKKEPIQESLTDQSCTKQEIVEETIEQRQTTEKKETASASLQPPQQITQQKPFTLAQLAKGFLEHIKDEGNDQITTIGQEGRTPTAEQLKHERYIEKLSWCLQNSFKINREKFPATGPIKTMVKVYLALNQNGTIKECGVVESSGHRSLDQFTRYIFEDASSSFPPVPHYLPHDPYKVMYIIEINTMHDTRIGLNFL